MDLGVFHFLTWQNSHVVHIKGSGLIYNLREAIPAYTYAYIVIIIMPAQDVSD